MGCSGSKSTREAEPTENIKSVHLDSSVASRSTSVATEVKTPTSASQMADTSRTSRFSPCGTTGEGIDDKNNYSGIGTMILTPNDDENAKSDDDTNNKIAIELPCCTYCCEDLNGPENEIPKPCVFCHAIVCGDCIRKQFTMACTDSLSMPPRCCTRPLNLKCAIPFLSPDEVTLFKEKFEEWRTVSPVYCPAVGCAAFIPYRLFPLEKRVLKKKMQRNFGEEVFEEAMVFYGHMIREMAPSEALSEWGLEMESASAAFPLPDPATVACPKCAIQICSDCKDVAHPQTPCDKSPLDIDPELEVVLKELKIKRCPKCHSGVRKMFGCSHILCRCGCQWCWYCAQEIVTCEEIGCGGGSDDDGDDEDDYEEDDGVDADDPTPGETSPIDTPDTSVAASSQPDTATPATENGEQHEASKPPRDLDAGGRTRWESNTYNFGIEGDLNRVDPWDCVHEWNFEIEGVRRRGYVNGEGLCENCWEEVGPLKTMFPEAAKLMETGELGEEDEGDGEVKEKKGADEGYYLCGYCYYVLCRRCHGEFGKTF